MIGKNWKHKNTNKQKLIILLKIKLPLFYGKSTLLTVKSKPIHRVFLLIIILLVIHKNPANDGFFVYFPGREVTITITITINIINVIKLYIFRYIYIQCRNTLLIL